MVSLIRIIRFQLSVSQLFETINRDFSYSKKWQHYPHRIHSEPESTYCNYKDNCNNKTITEKSQHSCNGDIVHGRQWEWDSNELQPIECARQCQ